MKYIHIPVLIVSIVLVSGSLQAAQAAASSALLTTSGLDVGASSFVYVCDEECAKIRTQLEALKKKNAQQRFVLIKNKINRRKAIDQKWFAIIGSAKKFQTQEALLNAEKRKFQALTTVCDSFSQKLQTECAEHDTAKKEIAFYLEQARKLNQDKRALKKQYDDLAAKVAKANQDDHAFLKRYFASCPPEFIEQSGLAKYAKDFTHDV